MFKIRKDMVTKAQFEEWKQKTDKEFDTEGAKNAFPDTKYADKRQEPMPYSIPTDSNAIPKDLQKKMEQNASDYLYLSTVFR